MEQSRSTTLSSNYKWKPHMSVQVCDAEARGLAPAGPEDEEAAVRQVCNAVDTSSQSSLPHTSAARQVSQQCSFVRVSVVL